MEHRYINQYAQGHGRWRQCENCGTAIHSRHFWFAGYRSKIEPPCGLHLLAPDDAARVEWFAAATAITHEEYGKMSG